MAYLTNVSQEQVGRGPSSGTVRIHWKFGNLIPNVVEVRQPADTTTAPTLLASVHIDSGKRTPTSIDLIVIAPRFLSLVVSPRTVQDGALTDKMVDDAGSLQYWENFSVQLPQFIVAADGNNPPTVARRKPSIVKVVVEEGVLTVHWTSPSVDHFNATLVPSIIPFQGQIELAGSDRTFTQHRVTRGRYRFSIQGCTQGVLHSNCSEWVVTDILMPPELGFQPWRRWFRIHPETVFGHKTQQVTAVSRTPGHLDLFVIGFDNAVWSTFWTQEGGWNPEGWFQIHAETVFDHKKQQVTAISRTPGHLDLFVIGFDNAVWSAFWSQESGWNRDGWFQIHAETVFDYRTQQVTAVSRTPGHLDLFVIGVDNDVCSTFWSQEGGWNREGWFQIHPETIFDNTTQQIAAVSRTPGHLDLFVIGLDNAVWSIFWTQEGGWNPEGWFQIHAETVFDYTTQQVTAISRTPGHLDLFVIGFDNAVWSAFWSQEGGWNRDGWFQIHPETVFDYKTQRVTAVSRTPGHLDLFVIGFDNAVWSAFWTQEGGWNRDGWFQIHAETVFDHTTQQVTALSRVPGHIDLFVIGFDDAVWSTWWD